MKLAEHDRHFRVISPIFSKYFAPEELQRCLVITRSRYDAYRPMQTQKSRSSTTESKLFWSVPLSPSPHFCEFETIGWSASIRTSSQHSLLDIAQNGSAFMVQKGIDDEETGIQHPVRLPYYLTFSFDRFVQSQRAKSRFDDLSTVSISGTSLFLRTVGGSRSVSSSIS